MKTVTFYSNTRYAGGRSHRNISTLEFVEGMDIFQAAEHYGCHLYPSSGEDFDNGVNDWNGNEVMDAADYKRFLETNIGQLDLGETVFTSCELKDISVDDFKVLPIQYQLDYVNIWYSDVDEELLKYAIDSESAESVFEYSEKEWEIALEDMINENM